MRIASGAVRTSCRNRPTAAAKAAIVLVAISADVIRTAGSRASRRFGGDPCHRGNVRGDAIMGRTMCDVVVLVAIQWRRRRVADN